MADVKISELTALASANVDASGDVLAVVDTSATATRKITVENLLAPITINKASNVITNLGTVSAATSITSSAFVGPLTGNVTGNVSGTAPAGTLTGATLASGVTASSLESVGTLTSLTVSGAPFVISNTNNGNNIDIKTTSSGSLVHAVKIHSAGLFEAKQGLSSTTGTFTDGVHFKGSAWNDIMIIGDTSRSNEEETHIRNGEVNFSINVNDGTYSAFSANHDGSAMTLGDDFGSGTLTITPPTTFNGDLVIGTAGKGISFAATSDATGMSSEILDDYEEGTWTPAIGYQNASGVSLDYATDGFQVGRYTKIGNVVHARFSIQVDISGSPVNDNISITGLPYTSINVTNLEGAGVADQLNITGKANYVLAMGLNSTQAGMILSSISGNQGDEIGTGDNYRFNGGITYMAA
jgi:hypothetical protein